MKKQNSEHTFKLLVLLCKFLFIYFSIFELFCVCFDFGFRLLYLMCESVDFFN